LGIGLEVFTLKETEAIVLQSSGFSIFSPLQTGRNIFHVMTQNISVSSSVMNYLDKSQETIQHVM
jgi:hypothetical protein